MLIEEKPEMNYYETVELNLFDQTKVTIKKHPVEINKAS